ncbi:hypothetical protein HID58_046554 [Brassica napus]|uniref:Uncharacterized protein n=1 Tax=Brassica napus TaxID=3708 RepID=A0ABQ8AWR5_BRANA|nr:hypothetical protein HID58_046554 [Brassica napus]
MCKSFLNIYLFVRCKKRPRHAPPILSSLIDVVHTALCIRFLFVWLLIICPNINESQRNRVKILVMAHPEEKISDAEHQNCNICSIKLTLSKANKLKKNNTDNQITEKASDRIKISGNENPTASDYDPLQHSRPLETANAHVQPACDGSTVESYWF